MGRSFLREYHLLGFSRGQSVKITMKTIVLLRTQQSDAQIKVGENLGLVVRKGRVE